MTCDHDYREDELEQSAAFALFGVMGWAVHDLMVPRECRKCGREEP